MKNKTEQIQTINHIRKPSSLYFVDRDGYLIEMDRKTKRRTRLSQIQKEKGYMYFVDRQLNICKTKMHRN
ncbi:MAG: hypothetical protein AAFO69_03105 [Bacteroidota bacterium]